MVAQGSRLLELNSSSGVVQLTLNLSAECTVSAPDDGNVLLLCEHTVQLVAPADNYDFADYPNPPPAGTTPHAQTAANFQKSLSDGTGYYTEGRVYTNYTAAHALQRLKETAVFFVFGHGGSAFQSCQTVWNGLVWGAIVQKPAARTQLVNQGMSYENIKVLEEEPAGAFSRVLLAVFEGCWTAYYNASWGSPADGVVARGAKCALGFTTTIFSNSDGTPGAEEWADRFWEALSMANKTIESAATIACDGIPVWKNLRNYKIVGDKTIKIAPARYGG
jgi:hypothetical protein